MKKTRPPQMIPGLNQELEDAVHAVFTRTVAFLRASLDLVHLTYDGVSAVTRVANISNILSEALTDSEPDTARQVDLERRASLAEEERTKGFPLLHAHTIVGMWGVLEASVEDLTACWLALHPEYYQSDPLARIKLPAAVLALTERERASLAIAELQKSADSGHGVGQFESLLKSVGLGGGVHEELRRSLHQMQQIRHCVAHRASTADAKLIAACPSLGYGIGDPITVDVEAFHDYARACAVYIRLIQNRYLAKLDRELFLGGLDELGIEQATPTSQS